MRRLGYRIVLVNSNPATIMTDPGMADATYIEPLDAPTLERIIAQERPDALLPNLGGQTALNLASELAQSGSWKSMACASSASRSTPSSAARTGRSSRTP